MHRSLPALILLLAGCADSVCETRSPHHDRLNTFWSRLDREYSLFDLRLDSSTSWEELGKRACSEVDLDPSNEGTFNAMLGMARALDDGQVRITTSEWTGDGRNEPWPHDAITDALVDHTEAFYIDSALRTVADDAFRWGRSGTFGYLSIGRLRDFAEPLGETSDILDARELLGDIFADIGGSNGMIVDLRSTRTGFRTVALAVTESFAGPQTTVWSTTERNGPGHSEFTRSEPVMLPASGPGAYDGPVVVLISPGTFGAAEALALALKSRGATLVGERTSGHLSNPVEAELNNTWTIRWSADRLTDPDGVIYDAMGVPPDVEVLFDPDVLDSPADAALDTALQLLGG